MYAFLYSKALIRENTNSEISKLYMITSLNLERNRSLRSFKITIGSLFIKQHDITEIQPSLLDLICEHHCT